MGEDNVLHFDDSTIIMDPAAILICPLFYMATGAELHTDGEGLILKYKTPGTSDWKMIVDTDTWEDKKTMKDIEVDKKKLQTPPTILFPPVDHFPVHPMDNIDKGNLKQECGSIAAGHFLTLMEAAFSTVQKK